MKEIYELVCEHFGMDASDVEEREVEEDDFEEICLDYSETEQEFSWRPEVSFTQQIKISFLGTTNSVFQKFILIS